MTHEDYTENKHHIFHTSKKDNSKEEKKASLNSSWCTKPTFLNLHSKKAKFLIVHDAFRSHHKYHFSTLSALLQR